MIRFSETNVSPQKPPCRAITSRMNPVTAAPAIRVPARGTPTEMRDTQIQWATKPTAGQIVGAYQSRVSMGCLKIAKSKQPEQILGKPWQRNFWEHINPLTS